jgi:hypothetical protein
LNFPYSEIPVFNDGLDLPPMYFLDDRPSLQDAMIGFNRFSKRQLNITRTKYLIEKILEFNNTEEVKRVCDSLGSLFIDDIVILYKRRLSVSQLNRNYQIQLLEKDTKAFFSYLQRVVFLKQVF